MHRLKGMIIDPDLASCSRLKHVAHVMQIFRDLRTAASFKEANAAFDVEGGWDIVFLSSRFPRQESLAFIGEVKTKEKMRDCGYILLLRQEETDRDMLATGLAHGVDGFLFEPFSADGLNECTNIAVRIKLNNGKARVKLGINLLLPEIITEIEMRKNAPDETSPGSDESLQEVKKTCKMLFELSSLSDVTYEDVIGEIFEEIEQQLPTSYQGSSKRLRQRLEKEIELRSELKQELLKIG